MSKVHVLSTFQLPDYLDGGILKQKTLKNFPMLKDKAGMPVSAINMYLTSFVNTNGSENTIKRTAYCLNILYTYCEYKRIKLQEFLEDDLVCLSRKLQDEVNENGKARNNTTVNNIIASIIRFFDFFGKTFLNNEKYSVSLLNAYEIKDQSGKKHRSMLLNSERKTLNPINANDIDAIYKNIPLLYKSTYAQERTKVLLMLLEYTGARIGELSTLTIFDIDNAIKNDNGLLRLNTLKRRQEIIRYVPVDKVILNKISTFIKIHRNKVIRKTIKDKDSKFLFVNENTGEKINTNSLSNDFNRLRKILNMESDMCAHMFRHRFITNIFINLMKQYDIENTGGLKNALLDINTLKAHVQQLTGHKDINSLDTYIHLAKSEILMVPIHHVHKN